MARFFITYSPQDEKSKTNLVRRLRNAFPNDNFRVDDEQSYTDAWWNDISLEIKKSDIFIYLLSLASFRSNICETQLKEAQRLKKPIIAVLISRGKISQFYLTHNPDDITYVQLLTATDFDNLIGKINEIREHLPSEALSPLFDLPTAKPKVPTTSIILRQNSKPKSRWFVFMPLILIGIIALIIIIGILPKNQSSQIGYPNGLMVTQNNQWQSVEHDFDGVAMMLVPRGCFMMGSSHNDDLDEKPVHEQCFDMPFWIDKYEVTQLQFSQFNAEKAKANGFTGSNRPVENINWFEARSFCELRGMRLPTEREWEYASRGPNNLIYPWGNDFIADNVAYNGTADRQTAIVGIRLNNVSWVGAFDMSGNVWEWVSSLYYPYPYDNDDENNNFSTNHRTLRGGSWYDGQDRTHTSYREGRNPNNQYNDGGFRCARDYTP